MFFMKHVSIIMAGGFHVAYSYQSPDIFIDLERNFGNDFDLRTSVSASTRKGSNEISRIPYKPIIRFFNCLYKKTLNKVGKYENSCILEDGRHRQ